MSSANDNRASSVADPNGQMHPPTDQPSPPSSSSQVDEITIYKLPVDSFTTPLTGSNETSASFEQPQVVPLASVSGKNLRLNFISSSPLVSAKPEVLSLDLVSRTPGRYHIYSLPKSSRLKITYPSSSNQVLVETVPNKVAVTRRRPRTACECPNCRAPEAEQLRYPDGALQHICHVNYCRRIFDRAPNLRRHLHWHRGTRSFLCMSCGKRFARSDKFREHARRHLKTKRSSRKPVAKAKCDCANCREDNEHRIVGRNGKPLHLHLCHVDGCNKVFIYAGNLRRHLDAHRGKLHFVCRYCKKRFRRKGNLDKHLKTHKVGRGNYPRRVKCSCPNCTAPGGNRTKGPDGKPLHVCNVGDCRQAFNFFGNLKRHLHLHTGEKKFGCSYCQRSFARKDKRDEHVRLHVIRQRLRKCKCPNCLGGKKVRGKNGRLMHVCHVSDCRKTYDRVVTLKKHLKVHNADQLHFCEVVKCPEVYLSKNRLEAHVKSKHTFQREQIKCPCANCNMLGGNIERDEDGKLIHNCPLPGCNKVFSRPSHVQRHLDTHGGKKKFICPNCPVGFARKESLKNHIMVHMDRGRKTTDR